MARNDIPNGWDKIRQNVQETERLIGQKQYNQSMIKAKQTVEYMVKLQCEQSGIMEGSYGSIIREPTTTAGSQSPPLSTTYRSTDPKAAKRR